MLTDGDCPAPHPPPLHINEALHAKRGVELPCSPAGSAGARVFYTDVVNRTSELRYRYTDTV
jgi:hypothetical protein